MVRRFDASTITARRDAAGILRGTAKLTRTGVLTYRNADGSTRNELRHPDEVGKADSISTLSLVPMTLGHPAKPVTSKNAKHVSIGAIGEAKFDGKFIRAPFMIHDDAAIVDVESGKAQEISCGYDCDLEFVSGTYEGEHYDAIQRNIEYNHAAVLPKGRAGSEVRIDGDDAISFHDDNEPAPRAHPKENNMKTIKLDGVDYPVDSPAFDQAFAKYQNGVDSKIADLTAQALTAKKEADANKGRADAAEAALVLAKADSAPEAIAKRIAQRVSIEKSATRVLGNEFKTDGKSDDEIRRAVILKVTPQAKLDGQTADYVAARFDHVVESFKQDAAIKSNAALRVDLDNLDNEDADDLLDDTKAQAAMAERNRSSWKPAIAK